MVSFASERVSVVATRGEGGTAANDSASFSFAIDGHRFVALTSRAFARDEDAGEASARAPVVGQIHTAAGTYVIVDERPAPGDALPSLAEGLSRRELQVALHIAEGRCDKEIARALGISSYTVREHIRRIFAKLKVSRRSAVAHHMLKLL